MRYLTIYIHFMEGMEEHVTSYLLVNSIKGYNFNKSSSIKVGYMWCRVVKIV